jgi:uncharacterized protein YjbI with pentapeptide repeats
MEIKKQTATLDVYESNLSESKFFRTCLERMHLRDVTLAGTKISDANLTDLEIEDAQLGGAYIHNVGVPPPGHPMYDPNKKQRPIKFENCNFTGSTISNCDLSYVEIKDCNVKGLRINGISIEDLIKLHT